MLETFFNQGTPSWTDKLQGIGAIISSLGAIVAFITLFLKDKDKQKQIDSLTIMSEQLMSISLSQQEQINSLSILANSSISSLEKQEEIKDTLKALATSYDNIAKLTKKRGR